MRRPRLPRPSMVMLPNGFTLMNLFFGIFAIVSAARGEHERAVWYIIIGAICDAIDGRVARATNTGSRFGEELDSLVDAISFGFAPAILMYFAVLRRDGLDWIFVFLYSACAVMRLARFNIEQAGRPKTHYNGLPSPVAGGVLATYYWFSQTPLYNETVIGDLPWHNMVRFLLAGLAFLMISNVPYPVVPTFSVKIAARCARAGRIRRLDLRPDFPAEGFLLSRRNALRDVRRRGLRAARPPRPAAAGWRR